MYNVQSCDWFDKRKFDVATVSHWKSVQVVGLSLNAKMVKKLIIYGMAERLLLWQWCHQYTRKNMQPCKNLPFTQLHKTRVEGPLILHFECCQPNKKSDRGSYLRSCSLYLSAFESKQHVNNRRLERERELYWPRDISIPAQPTTPLHFHEFMKLHDVGSAVSGDLLPNRVCLTLEHIICFCPALASECCLL